MASLPLQGIFTPGHGIYLSDFRRPMVVAGRRWPVHHRRIRISTTLSEHNHGEILPDDIRILAPSSVDNVTASNHEAGIVIVKEGSADDLDLE